MSSSTVYISVYTDFELRRVFCGADTESSDGGPPRVIVYGYDGLPMQPVAPPSPDYVPEPEHLLSPDYTEPLSRETPLRILSFSMCDVRVLLRVRSLHLCYTLFGATMEHSDHLLVAKMNVHLLQLELVHDLRDLSRNGIYHELLLHLDMMAMKSQVVNDICVLSSTERTASCDGTIHVWNTQSGKNISVTTEHAENYRQYGSSLIFVSRLHYEHANMLDFSSLGSGILSSTDDRSLYTCIVCIIWKLCGVSILDCSWTKFWSMLLGMRSVIIITSWQAHEGYVTKCLQERFTGLVKTGIIFCMRDVLEEAKSYAQPSSVMEKKDSFRSAYKKVVTQMVNVATATTLLAQQKDNAAPTCYTPDVEAAVMQRYNKMCLLCNWM
ncbi:protein GFS12 isoform X1 [Tanacetum coccineum]